MLQLADAGHHARGRDREAETAGMSRKSLWDLVVFVFLFFFSCLFTLLLLLLLVLLLSKIESRSVIESNYA